MSVVQTDAPEQACLSDEQRLVLRGIDWSTYRKISDALQGRHVRLTFDRGSLELMTISGMHSNLSRLIGRLIAVLTEEFGLLLKSFGDMTCDREDLDRALEPDECFYISNEPRVRTKGNIDLTVDPPPDLAVEVEISRSARTRLGIYAAIRVPEVWRFDGQDLTIHQLEANGEYRVAQHSRYFPFVTGPDLARFLEQRTAMDENALIRKFRDWVREQVAKRK
jgi:Uma2 family endonuclease